MFDSSKIQPHLAFTDLREWMAEADKLGELKTVRRACRNLQNIQTVPTVRSGFQRLERFERFELFNGPRIA